MPSNTDIVCTGRCYCGARTFTATQEPQTVAYCHCDSCRRATGGAVAAFAAFDERAVTFTPDEGGRINANPGVTRTFCTSCGSSLTGRYDYLPGQVYISLGVLDQANDHAPKFTLTIQSDLRGFTLTMIWSGSQRPVVRKSTKRHSKYCNPCAIF